MLAMIIIAVFPLVVLAAQPLGHLMFLGDSAFWVPIILVGIGASAHQAWSANLFTTVSDMFPKKSVGSVVGIGGMAGGVGGILINKIGGWLFDAYRKTGIENYWAEVKSTDLAAVANTVQNAVVTNRGEVVDLNARVLTGLSAEAKSQMLVIVENAGFSEAQFTALAAKQAEIVQAAMSTAYAMMFTYCAIAYLLAWFIMKTLVPKHKPISN
jgi:ACS family hexuronate transporter-like MFS transporter